MSESVIIRPATPADIDSMVDLLRSLFALEEDFSFSADRQRRGLRMMLEYDRACVFCASARNDEVVGMCTGQLTISTAEGNAAVLVEDMVVREDCRGKGLGQRLLEAVYGWARTQGAQRLQLLADDGNIPALDFYGHLGWERTRLICLRKRLQCSCND